MKVLGVVPARAGSKGVPGKNRREFHGKPLAAWAIECAKRTCPRVVVTSDDPIVLGLAEQYGVRAHARPDELAEDSTPMLDVLRDVLAHEEPYFPDVVVLLQPTQPLRTDAHVKLAQCWLSQRASVDSVVSVVPIPPHCSPDYAVTVDPKVGLLRINSTATSRQSCRAAYYRDGTVYAMRTDLVLRGSLYGRCLPLVIAPEDSCTIDTEDDWRRAETMWSERHV